MGKRWMEQLDRGEEVETGSEIPLLRTLAVNGVEAERAEATRAKGIFLCLSCIQRDLILMLMRESLWG